MSLILISCIAFWGDGEQNTVLSYTVFFSISKALSHYKELIDRLGMAIEWTKGKLEDDGIFLDMLWRPSILSETIVYFEIVHKYAGTHIWSRPGVIKRTRNKLGFPAFEFPLEISNCWFIDYSPFCLQLNEYLTKIYENMPSHIVA